jgi:MFS family permease
VPLATPTAADTDSPSPDCVGAATATRSAYRADIFVGRSDLWLIYVSNGLTMTAVSMLVRYADFVTFLGGGEAQLGLIVGIGMIGSLAMRLAQGVGIDRYGARRIWLWSLALYIGSILANSMLTSAYGPGIFLVRIMMQTAIAGIFGASITHVSRCAPPTRMAEMVGTVGIAGFVGMLVGPQLSDWICGHGITGQTELNRLFQTSAFVAGWGLLAAWLATRREVPPRSRRRLPLLALARRYQPGWVLFAVAVAAGAGLNLPFTFLRSFAVERHLSSIGLFFSWYAVTAIVVRLLTRSMFERYGNRPWTIAGLFLLAVSLVCYLPVRQPWHWLVPGTMAGIAHALLFPTIVAAGSTAFPERYRGLGTTLMLTMFDVGNLVGPPFVGGTLHMARSLALPAYGTMIVSVAALLSMVGAIYAICDRRPAKPVRRVGVPGSAGSRTVLRR